MIKQLKVQFRAFKEGKLIAETPKHEEVIVLCNEKQKEEINALSKYLYPENTLNLLYCRPLESGLYETDLIVYEPGYLVDVSMLAECFRPFGNHPLNYALSRLRAVENTRHILLGNIANFFIDELVNHNPGNSVAPVSYKNVLSKFFRISPLELTACEDLSSLDTEKAFFDSCLQQFNHIKHIVENIFPRENIDTNKIILEPSFICTALGLQGRLDIMLQDYSAFVELKSGKGVEDFHTKQLTQSAVNHYTQMILYLAILHVNLELDDEKVRSYLCYSKYPLLSREAHSKEQLQKAIFLRNAIVALEFSIQKKNNIDYTRKILNHIKPEVLNTANLSGKFYENYLKPQIDKFRSMMMLLNPLEQAYFLQLYTFIVKELWYSKLGEREFEGVKRASNLWSAPAADKMAVGEILYDLKIIDNQASSDAHFVTLSIPEYDNFYLPNFRTGDAVVLYEKNAEEDNVNNKQVFKGAIELINNHQVQIRIRAKQRNLHVLPVHSLYAVEHDYMDTVFTGMFNALYYFAYANQERKDLLLGRRSPEFNISKPENIDEQPDISRIVNKAMSAKDCFLLVGPPGTGKTSLALKKIVESCIENKTGNILLLAYTNRAVDEICKALTDIDEKFPFIRIGSELNCAPEYRNHLLDKCLGACNRRADVLKTISNCNVFVGTVASVSSKPDLFTLKQFDMAIVDEATQLLEPHLIGILSVKTKKGENAVKRFVLIGDHRQLPAVVLQTKEDTRISDPLLMEAGITNLSNSLFERLYCKYKNTNQTLAYDQLTMQGRMHPEIASFPSQYFYEGKLDCVGLPHQMEEWKYLQKRLIFIPSERTKRDRIDKINHQEAEIVASIIKQLYDRAKENGEDFCPETIGVITSYRNQIALIRKTLIDTGIQQLSEVIVDTVERFQGSQKDIIIYSFCINTFGQLKMLPNVIEESGQIIDRKLNVALTRARKQLYITGNRSLLSQNPVYNRLIEHIESHGSAHSFPK
ncbi:MAG: AAA domain-containing protein [Candidatus Azobacteroides sp.]|nr:AAA domain-containing protein [Candidatus Azobacteroides sp.]